MIPHISPTTTTSWRDAVGPGYQFAVTTDQILGRMPVRTGAARITRR